LAKNYSIILDFYSPLCPNLTVIVLPDLKRNEVQCQPGEIEMIIRDQIYNQLKEPNSIVLGVFDSNYHLDHHGTISLMQEVDPHFDRSIGVLTKVDMVKDVEKFRI
jgi:dynamin 1-like protein